MNIKLVIAIACISILTCSCANYGCYGSSYSYGSCQSCSSGCGPGYPSCRCTDPHCDGSNPCFSPGQCCHVFGNIGANSY